MAPAGGQSLLYWPLSPTDYVLQTTTNLATPNWVTASNAVTVNAMLVTNSAPSGYFRLLTQTNPTAGMVLGPVGARYRGRNPRRYFRADAAFADAKLCEYLEAEGFEYAIRLLVNLLNNKTLHNKPSQVKIT